MFIEEAHVSQTFESNTLNFDLTWREWTRNATLGLLPFTLIDFFSISLF